MLGGKLEQLPLLLGGSNFMMCNLDTSRYLLHSHACSLKRQVIRAPLPLHLRASPSIHFLQTHTAVLSDKPLVSIFLNAHPARGVGSNASSLRPPSAVLPASVLTACPDPVRACTAIPLELSFKHLLQLGPCASCLGWACSHPSSRNSFTSHFASHLPSGSDLFW